MRRCIRVLNQALVDLPSMGEEDVLEERLRRVIRAATKELKEDQDT